MLIGTKRLRKLLKKNQCHCLLSQDQRHALTVHLRGYQDLHLIRHRAATHLIKANQAIVLLNHSILAMVHLKGGNPSGCLLNLSNLCLETKRLKKKKLLLPINGSMAFLLKKNNLGLLCPKISSQNLVPLALGSKQLVLLKCSNLILGQLHRCSLYLVLSRNNQQISLIILNILGMTHLVSGRQRMVLIKGNSQAMALINHNTQTMVLSRNNQQISLIILNILGMTHLVSGRQRMVLIKGNSQAMALINHNTQTMVLVKHNSPDMGLIKQNSLVMALIKGNSLVMALIKGNSLCMALS
ncbi:hypothetical protein ACQ4PT_043416 [Festuca glaucescens]